MTRPGHGQWPAMDTAALGQAVGALNAAELGSIDGGGGLSLHAHAWWLKGHCNGNRARALERGRGGSDGAGREQGRVLLGLMAAVAQVGRGKKR